MHMTRYRNSIGIQRCPHIGTIHGKGQLTLDQGQGHKVQLKHENNKNTNRIQTVKL